MAEVTADVLGRTHAQPIVQSKSKPIIGWATLGLLFVCFEAYVWISWITGPHFVPTDPGPDVLPGYQAFMLNLLQIVIPLLFFLCIWYWVVKPWRREGRMTNDGMMAIACWAICIYDCIMNYTSTTLLYNSHAVNFGAWTTGSFPGWTQPVGNLLPEPVFITIPGYMVLVFSQVVLICWLLRKIQARRPHMGIFTAVGAIILGLFIVDSAIEILLLQSGIYAYPGGIREITLFSGEVYQFPLTEGFLFGGLALGSLAVLKFFKDDKGYTFVERGVESLKVSEPRKTGLRFLAIFGYFHLMFLVLYGVPNQWLATHSDPYPENMPSYLDNGMCVYGPERNKCPGPGVMMPRPENNPF